MELNEALDFMAKRYGLRFQVNDRAFKYEQLMDVRRTPIAEQPIPRPAGLILPGRVLEAVLVKVPVPSGAVFFIRPQGHIEITTKQFLLAELNGLGPLEDPAAGAGK